MFELMIFRTSRLVGYVFSLPGGYPNATIKCSRHLGLAMEKTATGRETVTTTTTTPPAAPPPPAAAAILLTASSSTTSSSGCSR